MGGNFKFLKELYKLELLTAFEYRFNLIMQTFGMFVNDAFWIIFWTILFDRFTTIGGWQFNDMLKRSAVSAAGYGVAHVLFGNVGRLARMIEEGKIDYYLTLPKNVLLHSIVRLQYGALGDLLFGITAAFFSISFKQIPLYLYLVL